MHDLYQMELLRQHRDDLAREVANRRLARALRRARRGRSGVPGTSAKGSVGERWVAREGESQTA